MKRTKERRKSAEGPDKETDARKWTEGITGITAVGVKPDRTKGNKQKAKYQNQEGMHEKSGKREWGKR